MLLHLITLNMRYMITKVNCAIDSNMQDIVLDLQTLIRQPSSASNKQNLFRCAHLVAATMTKANIKTELIYLNDQGEDDIPPIVFGEVKSRSNPLGKTILFYNHYDVQPEGPVDLWNNVHPFSGEVDGNYIFGRGSADDKGELITRIKAVEYYLKETSDVPCNVKFIIEGEEEIGSTNLENYLFHYKKRIGKCDTVIWESGTIDEKDRAIIELGVKGILSVELFAKGPSIDAHSSLAVLIENPAWILVRALNTILDYNNNEKIMIDDWYKEVREFTTAELNILNNELFDEHEFKTEYGIKRLNNNLQSRTEINKALAGKPTCNIAGLISGYTGEGAKTVLPSTALAKLDFRLVPNMVPAKQFSRLQNHLNKHGFENIRLTYIDGVPPHRTPTDSPFVNLVEEVAREVFGKAIISVSSAGTGPMYYFDKLLGPLPVICIGGPNKYCRAHSPNEFTRIDLLNKTTKCIAGIIEKVGN